MSSAYDVVRTFEATIAEYAGSKFGIAVESCTAALFLSLMYVGVKNESVSIPKFTYPSVPCQIIFAGAKPLFSDEEWQGIYELGHTGIWDGALRFKKGMYRGGLHCLSFHSKKLLPIGRGGMILTDDEDVCKWLKKARFDGRDEAPLSQTSISMLGWNAYMTPDQAARGLMLFDLIKNENLADLDSSKQSYPDLSKMEIYK